MKLLQIVPRDGTRLYGAMIKKQAEIRRSGRGTFLRAGTRKRKAARWTHVRYKGSINLELGPSQAVEAVIKSRDRCGYCHRFSAGLIGISARVYRRLTSNTEKPTAEVVKIVPGSVQFVWHYQQEHIRLTKFNVFPKLNAMSAVRRKRPSLEIDASRRARGVLARIVNAVAAKAPTTMRAFGILRDRPPAQDGFVVFGLLAGL